MNAEPIALEETKKEKNQVIAHKDSEIAEQKAKMEEMAVEFGEMLKETLDKMSERIEVATTHQEDEHEHEALSTWIARLRPMMRTSVR